MAKLARFPAIFGRQYATMSIPDNMIPPPYTGISYAKATERRKTHLFPTTTPYYKKPLMICDGRKQYLFDTEGKRYLDLFAGIVTVSVGHCHPKVVEAATKQMNRLWHTTQIYMTEPVLKYAEKLTAKMPGDLKSIFFTNSGSEANDLALTLARLYTGNLDIISLRNGYHGMTNLVMGITNLNVYKHSLIHSNFHRSMNPNPYSGPWGGRNCRDSPVQPDRDCDCATGECKASQQYVKQIQDVLDYCVPKKGVAAFIAESMQGVGTVQLPRYFLKQSVELIRQNNGLYIADEVQTGFGRTGEHFWGFEGHGVMPDIVTMAKGIGNGFPMGAVVTRPEIAQALGRAMFFNTFGGNPVACSVGEAVLDVIEEEKLQQNAHKVGTRFLQKLELLRDRSSIIGDVRGKGLMICVELVADKTTRKPLEPERMSTVFEKLKDCGVLVGKGSLHGNVLRIKPPMCITDQNVDFAMEVFENILK